MKLTNSQRDKRIIQILILFGITFSLLAAMSGNGYFLFGMVVFSLLWLFSKVLLKNQWYIASGLKHSQGDFNLFPVVQSLIIIPVAIVCIAISFGIVRLLENAL